jgi:hypothetical protein
MKSSIPVSGGIDVRLPSSLGVRHCAESGLEFVVSFHLADFHHHVEALGGTGLRKEGDAEEQRYQNRADAHEKSC